MPEPENPKTFEDWKSRCWQEYQKTRFPETKVFRGIQAAFAFIEKNWEAMKETCGDGTEAP